MGLRDDLLSFQRDLESLKSRAHELETDADKMRDKLSEIIKEAGKIEKET